MNVVYLNEEEIKMILSSLESYKSIIKQTMKHKNKKFLLRKQLVIRFIEMANKKI